MSELSELRARCGAAERENAEWRQSFDLYNSAVQRGVKLWQERHSEGTPEVWPDGAQMVAWLIEQLTAQAQEMHRHNQQALAEAHRIGQEERDRAVAAVRELRAALKEVDIAHQPYSWVESVKALLARTTEWAE